MGKLYGRILGVALMSCGIAVGVVGCAAEKPQSTVSRGVDSGVTSSNGGGMAPSNYGNVSTRTTAP